MAMLIIGWHFLKIRTAFVIVLQPHETKNRSL